MSKLTQEQAIRAYDYLNGSSLVVDKHNDGKDWITITSETPEELATDWLIYEGLVLVAKGVALPLTAFFEVFFGESELGTGIPQEELPPEFINLTRPFEIEGSRLLTNLFPEGRSGLVEKLKEIKTNQKLLDAVQVGDCELVKQAIREGADIETVDHRVSPYQLRSLHLAVLAANTELVKVLLSLGADPLAKTTNGGAPLHFTTDASIHSAFQAHANQKLLDAVQVGNCELVKQAIREGADIETVDHRVSPYQLRALHLAAHVGNTELVNVLLSLGANPIAKTSNGYTPRDLTTNPPVYSAFQAHANQKLLDAVQVGDCELVKQAIREGADIETVDHRVSPYQLRSLHLAVLAANTELVKVLLSLGADPLAKTTNGGAPLHFTTDASVHSAFQAHANQKLLDAVQVGNCELVKQAIKEGADIETVDHRVSPYHLRSLHFAAHVGNTELVNVLLSLGANPIARTSNGYTPRDLTTNPPVYSAFQAHANQKLLDAVQVGNCELVKQAIIEGADIETVDHRVSPYQLRALHIAAHVGNTELVNVLLSLGANPIAKTSNGYTPRDLTTNPPVYSALDNIQKKNYNEQMSIGSINLGNQVFSTGHYDLAISLYNQALSFAPNNKSIYFHRAKAYAALGNYNQAISDNNTSQSSANFDQNALQLYNDIQVKMSNERRAREHVILGLNLSSTQYHHMAIAQFNEALTFNPAIAKDIEPLREAEQKSIDLKSHRSIVSAPTAEPAAPHKKKKKKKGINKIIKEVKGSMSAVSKGVKPITKLCNKVDRALQKVTAPIVSPITNLISPIVTPVLTPFLPALSMVSQALNIVNPILTPVRILSGGGTLYSACMAVAQEQLSRLIAAPIEQTLNRIFNPVGAIIGDITASISPVLGTIQQLQSFSNNLSQITNNLTTTAEIKQPENQNTEPKSLTELVEEKITNHFIAPVEVAIDRVLNPVDSFVKDVKNSISPIINIVNQSPVIFNEVSELVTNLTSPVLDINIQANLTVLPKDSQNQKAEHNASYMNKEEQVPLQKTIHRVSEQKVAQLLSSKNTKHGLAAPFPQVNDDSPYFNKDVGTVPIYVAKKHLPEPWYRGAKRQPELIFDIGFKSHGKNPCMLNHTCPPGDGEFAKDSKYVATSKSKRVAAGFPRELPFENKLIYIYEIEPQSNAKNVIEELPKIKGFTKYQEDFEVNLKYEEEMAIPEKIKSQNIRGAWPVETIHEANAPSRIVTSSAVFAGEHYRIPLTGKNNFIPNPNYVSPDYYQQQLVRTVRGIGKGMTVLAVGMDGASFYQQYNISVESGNYTNTYLEGTRIVGGWTGAVIGAEVAALYCAPLAAVNPFLPIGCGVVGGLAGYYGGSALAENQLNTAFEVIELETTNKIGTFQPEKSNLQLFSIFRPENTSAKSEDCNMLLYGFQ